MSIDPGSFVEFTDFNPEVDSESAESHHAVITHLLSEGNGATELVVTDDCGGDEKKDAESENFGRIVLPKLKDLLEK